MFHLFELSDKLDYSAGGNDYKRLAGMYKFSRDDIEQLGLSQLRDKINLYLNVRTYRGGRVPFIRTE